MCGGFLIGEERLPCEEVMASKVFLTEGESDLAVKDNMVFSVKVMSTVAGRAFAGIVEIVICIGPKSDRVICTKVVTSDKARDSIGYESVFILNGGFHGRGGRVLPSGGIQTIADGWIEKV